MGITGLLPFLAASSRKCNINEFRGCTVAINAYCWLHKGAATCAEELVRGEQTNLYITYCLKYIHLLQSYNIKPILVFDGQLLPARKDAETKRRSLKKYARAKGMKLLRLGETERARQCFQQCVDITHEMALLLIKECRSRNIDCIVAPYEVNAQLAFLNIQGIADCIINEDSDLILFGCSKILFNLKTDGFGVLVEKDNLNKSMRMRPDQYSFEKFRCMCIMSGCDYLNSLPGIGIIRAYKAVLMTDDDIYNLLPQLPRYLNLSKLVVTTEYIENFKIAEATIKHQIVYDPINRKLRSITDPLETNTNLRYLKNIGEISDSETAFQMALGNIDPVSKKILDNWNPDTDPTINSSSIWSPTYTKPEHPEKSEIIPVAKTKNTENIDVQISTEVLPETQRKVCNSYENIKEELKVFNNIEPPVKRLKIDEMCGTKIEVQAEIHSNTTSFTEKSQTTSLLESDLVTTEFLGSNSDQVSKICNLVEQMDTEDTKLNRNSNLDLNDSNISQYKINDASVTLEKLPFKNNNLSSFAHQSAFNQISLCDNKSSVNHDVLYKHDPTTSILSFGQSRAAGDLRSFEYDYIEGTFGHSSFESALIEKSSSCDDIESNDESDYDQSCDFNVESENEDALEQSSDEQFSDNIQFMTEKI